MPLQTLIRRVTGGGRSRSGGSHATCPTGRLEKAPRKGAASHQPRALIVGSPNVGKSMLFNRLTGRYVTVSNYPGTTIEVSRGRARIPANGDEVEIIDTPGMYCLSPVTEEERVASSMLLQDRPAAVVHVIDAKNIARMLPLTLQLIEADLPVVLALNMSDEARRLGIRINAGRLEELLGLAVVQTVGTTGRGVDELIERIAEVRSAGRAASRRHVPYGEVVDQALDRLTVCMGPDGPLSPRARAALLLRGGREALPELEQGPAPAGAGTDGNGDGDEIDRILADARRRLTHSVHYHMMLAVRSEADRIVGQVVRYPSEESPSISERLSRLCMHPLTGLPILLLVLYFGVYKFVGVFGAGTLVDALEGVFETHVNPPVDQALEWMVPWQVVRELFGGEFGIITLGIRYAVAIVLPVVGTFFLAFSVIEDSGYLPRLAMLIDRLFKRIGLNGRAVIPIVLGFGCDTMATIVTRTLESRREKIICSFLLALAIPCSAQLGVILALLSGHPLALGVWAVVVGGIFLLAGGVTSKLLPGKGPSFYMELPPLRLPKLRNVTVKTYSRMVWYAREVLPLFIIASVVIWVGRVTGIFQALLAGLRPVVGLLGLPGDSATAFLFGFFRRDYGAAGLFDLQRTGGLTGNQLAVAAITLTLFLPCVAQLLILKKELGWKVTLLTSGGILLTAFGVGAAVHQVLAMTGVSL